MQFGLSVDDSHPPYAVLSAAGEIDVATAPDLRAALLELIGEGRNRIVVDLEQVEFLDSTGLGVLVSSVKRVRADGGDLTVVCTRPHILKVFEITGLTSVFSVHDSLATAVAS